MTIRLAETAGMCFGANRAVDMLGEIVSKESSVFTLGPIVHNRQVVEDFAARGVRTVDAPEQVDNGSVLLIRAHGVSEDIISRIENKGVRCVDATCPFVSKIHTIVSRESDAGKTVLIAGDAAHPEVLGIAGHCHGEYYVFNSIEELDNLIKNNPQLKQKEIAAVAQTTFNANLWEKCVEILNLVFTSPKVFATICKATLLRQEEAARLSSQSDLMIVIGGRNSSNTLKLVKICQANCRTVHIEQASELTPEIFAGATNIGITAGASTPAGIIKEVIHMTENMNNIGAEENFEQLLEESFKKIDSKGKVVHGTVSEITPSEIHVNVDGRKQTGIVTLDELTDNPNLTPADCVKVGDEFDFLILKTNDQDGHIYLSKKKMDSYAAWEEIKNAAPKLISKRKRRDKDNDDEPVTMEEAENEEKAESAEAAAPAPVEEAPAEEKEEVVFEGVVTDVVKGGVKVSYKGVRVFIPAFHATLTRGEPLEGLLKKTVKFVLLEADPDRKDAVGSIRKVLSKARKAEEESFWNSIEVGQIFHGKVKSLTSYGAFVDLGVVDGMIHISELSWNRIKHPSEVVNVGDEVEVYVKKLDKEKKKISLGYKKTEDNPWEIMKNSYPVGTVIEAPVVGTPSFGAFVNILPGIDGLVHISQLSTQRVEKPTDVVKEGDIVRAVITDVDYDQKRVSLSMRALLEDNDEAEDDYDDDQPAEDDAE